MSSPGCAALILTFALVGAAQTMIDLNTVTFAAQRHASSLSGLVLTIIALASAISGLWFGSRPQRMTPGRKLPAALSLLASGMLPFAVAPGVWFLFPAAALLGFTVAPAIITGFSTAGLLVQSAQVTEGLTWITSAMGTGIGIGSAAAGQLAGGWDGRSGFACAAGCAAAAVFAGYAVQRWTRQRGAGNRTRADALRERPAGQI